VSLTTGVVRQAISVPRSSVLPDPDDPFSTIVYTVKSGKSRRVRVKTGLETSDSVEIIDGLKEGDTVIVSGSYGLPEGVEVKEAVTAVDE
ncbi:MAG: hypothetical protein K8F91_25325, partial [Candidatus Obscuribacterales bacterium]|nr:hypothetical protein [Candidatus Obscuribacterales bacterium]